MADGGQRIDLVLFGATGFAGQFGVEEAARLAKEKTFTWAVAGRNKTKLEKVLQVAAQQTGTDLRHIPIIVADINDSESLFKMACQAHIVLTYVGPYVTLGEPVVQACIEGGAHLLDLSAEPLFLESIELRYNQSAKENQVYVIGGCGYGFIPSDLGAAFTRDKFEGELNSVELYFHYPNLLRTRYHFGTWQSLLRIFGQQNELKTVRRTLNYEPLPEVEPKLKKRSLLHYSDFMRAWCLRYISPDKSVLNRSQHYFHKAQNKRPLQTRCYLVCSSLLMAILYMTAAGIVFGLASFKCGRWLLETFPRLFSAGFISHEGPTKEQMQKSSFEITLHGKGWSDKLESPIEAQTDYPNKTITVEVKGTNTAYGATNTIFLLSALTLLKEKEKLPGKGGVLTSAAAFHNSSLVEELNKHGVTFQVVRRH